MEWLRRLGKAAARRVILAASSVIGAKLGELLIELVTGEDKDKEPPPGDEGVSS